MIKRNSPPGKQLAEKACALPQKVRGRRKMEAESGRGAILAAAIPAFGRYGFEGTSLRQLAKEAGVDASLVSHLFGSKLKLWQAVLIELSNELQNHESFFACLRSEKSIRLRLQLLIVWIIERCEARPYFGVIVLRESLIGDERLKLLVSILLKPLQQRLAPFLNEVIGADEVVCEHANELFMALFNGVSTRVAGQRLQRVLTSPSQPLSQQEIFEQTWRAVCRTAAPAPETIRTVPLR